MEVKEMIMDLFQWQAGDSSAMADDMHRTAIGKTPMSGVSHRQTGVIG